MQRKGAIVPIGDAGSEETRAPRVGQGVTGVRARRQGPRAARRTQSAGAVPVATEAAGGAIWPAASPTGKWQATWWPGATSRSRGSSAAQRSWA